MKDKKLSKDEIIRKLKEHNDTLKRYGVERIGLFGSFARGEEGKNSDIDFMVEFVKPDFDNFMGLSYFLEDLFKKRVEILTPTGIESIRIKSVGEAIKRSLVYV